MRYHSLAVDEKTLPAEFRVTARTPEGEVMGLRHASWPLEGVQFHPESYRTEEGEALLRNFLKQ
jgi:anthranilate/para-aminobenzoate synthase component II